ncbi:MAG: glutamate formimidoyltransferase, partial [Negativicutes bacterium]|nr:glutamate formimidoyltransferase [Negativicutes bacterium]
MKKIIETVPNFSVGRDRQALERIIAPFVNTPSVKLLDYSQDPTHNRAVVTVVGEPSALAGAVVQAVGLAIANIDMNSHQGEHPRLGAVDVVPFIPIAGLDMDEAVSLADHTARQIAELYSLPVYLYERSARNPERENLANIRKGQYEGLADKMADPAWKPDYGPDRPHPTAGAVVVGARMPLIAFNINLATTDVKIADSIARSIRHISGGLRYCKALAIDMSEKGYSQVSVNMTDYTRTPLHRVFELVKIEARRYGVAVIGSEIIGLTPLRAICDCANYY